MIMATENKEQTIPSGKYKCAVMTPYGKIFDDVVDSLVAPGYEGSFGVLAKHAPIVSRLKKGIVLIKKDGQEIIFEIDSGILEVNNANHNVLILADHAVKK